MSPLHRTSILLILLCQTAACVSAAPAQSQSQPQSRPVVATVAGQPLYDDELMPFVETQLNDLKRQEYTLKMKALDQAIGKKLLASEAEKRKITVDALLQAEADGKVSDPSDGEIEAYYQAQKDALKVPLDQVRGQISQSLKQGRVNQAREAYKVILRQRVSVDILLSAPRVTVAVDPQRVKGNPDAPVTIVEFSDFECPYCRQAEPTLAKVTAEYGDKIRIAYRDLPLSNIHSRATPAAEASRCAAEQGKFWPYHELLFKEPVRLGESDLTEYAETVKLDMGQFKSCVDGAKFRQQVQSDYQDGLRAGVNGTPAFFINGVALIGSQPLNEFRQTIDRELEFAKAKNRKMN